MFTSTTFIKLINSTLDSHKATLAKFPDLPVTTKTRPDLSYLAKHLGLVKINAYIDFNFVTHNTIKINVNSEMLKQIISKHDFNLSADLELAINTIYKLDKQTIKIGKLVKRMNSKLTDKEVLEIAEKFISKTYYLYYTNQNVDLIYRTMRQERDLSSCMAYSPRSYNRLDDDGNYIHPVQAYNDSPNLRLLVACKEKLENIKLDDKTKLPFYARSIVNVQTKAAPRSYGEPNITFLLNRLFDKKYLCGGLLTKIYDRYNGLVCPYIDGENCVDVEKNYIKIVYNGEFQPDHSTGSLDNGNSTCDCCGDRFDSENEGAYIDDRLVCGQCLDNEYTFITYDDLYEYVHNDDVVYCEILGEHIRECDSILCLSDDNYYPVDHEDIYICDHSGDYYLIDDLVSVEYEHYHIDLKGEVFDYCSENNDYYLIDDLFFCEHNNEYYHNEYLVTVEYNNEKFNIFEESVLEFCEGVKDENLIDLFVTCSVDNESYNINECFIIDDEIKHISNIE